MEHGAIENAGVANKIARRMVVPPQRDGGQRQYIDLPVPTCDADSLAPLLSWMREHLAEELSIRTLAGRAAMSAIGTQLASSCRPMPALRRRRQAVAARSAFDRGAEFDA